MKKGVTFAVRQARPAVFVCHLHGDLYGYGHVLLGIHQSLCATVDSNVRVYLHWPAGSPYSLPDDVRWPGVRLLSRSRLADAVAARSLSAAWPEPLAKASSAARQLGRTLAVSGPAVAFGSRTSAHAMEVEARLGIPSGARVVAWHVRTPSFRMEIRGREDPQDAARNNDFEVYRSGLRALQQAGYVVVRLGHPMEPPCGIDGVIEYGRSPAQSLAMDLWFVKRSAFMIGSDSGPFCLAPLAGTPCLVVGACTLADYWRRAGDRLLPKPLYDEDLGRRCTLTERMAGGLVSAKAVERANVAGARRHFQPVSADDVRLAIEEMRVLAERRVEGAVAGERSASQQAVRDWFRQQGGEFAQQERQAAGEFADVFAMTEANALT